MKILDVERLARQLPHCTAASLSRSLSAAGQLVLMFSESYAAAQEWSWREPVTLRYRGEVLFHGQVTAIAPHGSGLAYGVRVVVSDLLWQMDRLTLGEQLADLRAAQTATEQGVGAAMRWRASATAAMGSWQELARSCSSTAEGWSTDGSGITVLVDPNLPSVGRVLKKEGPVSQWTAVRALLQANPGSALSVDYETGTVRIFDVFAGEPEVWNTGAAVILSADLAPNYAAAVSGVAVAVTWQDGAAHGTSVVKYPAVIDPADDGVRLFTASAANGAQAQQQASYILRQLTDYFDKASRVQNYGSLTVPAEVVPRSMLGKHFLLVGDGAAEPWAECDNVVSAESWDLLASRVSLSIGLNVAAPSFEQMTFPDGGGGGGTGSGGGGAGTESVETATQEPPPTGGTGAALVLTVDEVTYNDLGGGRYDANIRFHTNRRADYTVSVDGGPYENAGSGTSQTLGLVLDYGKHTVSLFAVDGPDSAEVPLEVDFTGSDTAGTQTRETQETSETAETGGTEETQEPTPPRIPIWVQVVATQDPADVYTAEIMVFSQIPNARFRITLEGFPTVQASRLKAYNLQYGKAYPYTATAIDPVTLEEHTKTGVILRTREDWDVPTGPTPPPTQPVPPTVTPTQTPTQPVPPTGGGDCPCAEKWAELEQWKERIEARLRALEGGTDETLLAALSREIDTALAHVQVEITAGGVLEHTAFGQLKFTTNVSY